MRLSDRWPRHRYHEVCRRIRQHAGTPTRFRDGWSRTRPHRANHRFSSKILRWRHWISSPMKFGDSRHAKDQIRNRKPLGPASAQVTRRFRFVVPGRLRLGADSFRALPQFKDYPASEIFSGTPAAPKLVTPLEQDYAARIRGGVEKGYGVFRDGK